jgi:hypothetical protein
MASTTTGIYGQFLSALATEKINLTGDALKVMLVSSSYTPNQATDQFASTPQAFEITGTGYTEGGMALTGVTLTQGNPLTLSADNLSWTGGIFTGAAFAIVYDFFTGNLATSPLIGFVNFGGTIGSSVASPLTITWASGNGSSGVVLQITPASASAPAFDAVGSGGVANFATSMSGSHNAAAGAQVLAFINLDADSASVNASITSVTYGAAPMTFLGSIGLNNNSGSPLAVYGLSNAPAGVQTVTVNFNKSAGTAAGPLATFCTVSYTGISSVGTPSTTSGSGSSLSQSLTSSSGQIIAQAFGAFQGVSAVSGGTQRFIGDVTVDGSPFAGLGVQDSASSADFTATLSGSLGGAGIGVVLS